MTTAQVVETSVTVTNSSFQNYTHPDDHTTRTTDTPGFKPFTIFIVRFFTRLQNLAVFQQTLQNLAFQSNICHNVDIYYSLLLFWYLCTKHTVSPSTKRLSASLSNTLLASNLLSSTLLTLCQTIPANRPDFIGTLPNLTFKTYKNQLVNIAVLKKNV